MPKIRISYRRGGFTLVELMIVVAIVSLLAAAAIPNFMRYQARSRRSEAYANVASLARAENAYRAERNEFVDTFDVSGQVSLPDYTMYNSGILGPYKMPWDNASQAAFATIGWSPEGQVYYSYAAYTQLTGSGCATCEGCFTAVAFGDVDGDTIGGAVLFVHPSDEDGGLQQCIEPGLDFTTPVDGNGNPIYDAAAAYSASSY